MTDKGTSTMYIGIPYIICNWIPAKVAGEEKIKFDQNRTITKQHDNRESLVEM